MNRMGMQVDAHASTLIAVLAKQLGVPAVTLGLCVEGAMKEAWSTSRAPAGSRLKPLLLCIVPL